MAEIPNEITGEAKTARDINTTIANIALDGRIDGKDRDAIQALVDLYENDRSDIINESKISFQNILRESLAKWYTISTQRDYDALWKMLRLIDLWFQIPSLEQVNTHYKLENRGFSVILVWESLNFYRLNPYNRKEFNDYYLWDYKMRDQVFHQRFLWSIFGLNQWNDDNEITTNGLIVPSFIPDEMKNKLAVFPLIPHPVSWNYTYIWVDAQGNGYVYQWEFQNRKKHGAGELVFENGTKLQWEWKDGQFLQVSKDSANESVSDESALDSRQEEIRDPSSSPLYALWSWGEVKIETSMQGAQKQVSVDTRLNVRDGETGEIRKKLSNWEVVTLTGNTKTISTLLFCEIEWGGYVSDHYLREFKQVGAILPDEKIVTDWAPSSPDSDSWETESKEEDSEKRDSITLEAQDILSNLKNGITFDSISKYNSFSQIYSTLNLPNLPSLWVKPERLNGRVSIRKSRNTLLVFAENRFGNFVQIARVNKKWESRKVTAWWRNLWRRDRQQDNTSFEW